MDTIQQHQHGSDPAWRLGTIGRIALAVLAMAAAYFLWTEHRAYVVQYLPWALFALCPLMHVFMGCSHRGHDTHRGDERGARAA